MYYQSVLSVVCVETRHMQAVLKAQINKTDRSIRFTMLFRRERCKATASAKAFKRIGCRRLLRLVAVLQTFLQSVHAMIELSDLDHFAKVPTRAESPPASAGVNSPSATALTMAAIAVTGRRSRAHAPKLLPPHVRLAADRQLTSLISG